MPLDQISPIAPARVRALLLPAGRIKRSRFAGFVERLGVENAVRLGDISPDVRPDRSTFSPLAFPNGFILYNLTTSSPPPPHLAMSPFETFREPFLVFCIADGQEYKDWSTPGNTQQFDNSMASLVSDVRVAREQYPYALIVQLLVFETTGKDLQDRLPRGALSVPSLEQSKTTTLKTIMCDISARLLAEIPVLARNVQEQQSIVSPGASSRIAARRSGTQIDQSSATRLEKILPDLPSRPTTPAANGTGAEVRSSTSSPSRSGVGDRQKDSSNSRSSTPIEDGTRHNASHKDSFEGSGTNAASIYSREETQTSSNIDRPMSRSGTMAASAERAKTRLKVRQGLIVGSLYLQSGRWPDALRELVDNTTRAQTLGDHLWHAKGLENILVTMILLAWAGFDFQIPRVCFSSDKTTTFRPSSTGSVAMSEIRSSTDSANLRVLQNLSSALFDLVQMIVTVYIRAMYFQGEEPPQFSFSESVVRLSYLLAIVQRSGGQLDQKALQFIILSKPMSHRNSTIHRESTASKAMRNDILALLFRGFPADSQPGSASVTDRVIILSEMASVLSFTGMHRKRAFITRELFLTLIPALVHARKVGAAELGLHPAASLALIQNTVSKRSSTSVRGKDGQDTYTAFTFLMASLCQTFGVVMDSPLQQVLLPEDDMTSDPAQISTLILADALDLQRGNRTLKMEVLRLCVNFAEALPNFSDAIFFSTKLLQIVSPLAISQSVMSDHVLSMSPEEQIRFAMKVYRGGDSFHSKLSSQRTILYWDAFLVRDLQLLDNLQVKTIVKHSKSDFDGSRGVNIVSSPMGTDKPVPFLHSALNKAVGQVSKEKILVAGEDTNLEVLLQNPFDFDLAIEEIRLIAQGAALQNQPRSVVIGPRRLEYIPISFIPSSPGELRIIGCSAKIAGCHVCTFPIFRGSWATKPEIKIKTNASRRDSISSVISASEDLSDQQRWLPTIETFAVQQAQPLLEVASTSLSQSTLAVLQGETSSFFVTIRNVSEHVAVDFVHLSFADTLANSSRITSQARSSAFERYELEYLEIHRQTFKWRRVEDPASMEIRPGGSATFEVEVFGRAGLDHCNVLIDYANFGCDLENVAKEFYTRRLNLPLTVTVNASVQLQRVDTISIHNDLWPELSLSTANENAQHKHARHRSWVASERAQPSIPTFVIDNSKVATIFRSSSLFMLLLDIQNTWLQPLAISISSTSSDTETHYNESASKLSQSRVVIQPGHVTRVAVPVPKISIDNPYAQVPVLNPANEKQYVVDKEQWPTDILNSALEAFWFREELLKRVKADWIEPETKRQGIIDLRGIRLSQEMIQTMLQHQVEVQLEVVAISGSRGGVRTLGPTAFQVLTNDMLSIQAKLHNTHSHDMRAIVRFSFGLSESFSGDQVDLTQRITWTGLLRQTAGTIKSAQQVARRLGVCILAPGNYDVAVSVERFSVDMLKSPSDKRILGSSICKITATNE